MKIGLFFGSFNPIHIGHLIIADTVAQSPNVDQVWFVVSPQNPFKKKANLLHEFDRLDMVRLAVGDNPKLNVSDIEFRMPKPSYTVDTLAYLKDKYPQHSFRVVIGEDNLTHFHKWKNHDRILEDYGLTVYPRPGTNGKEQAEHVNISFVDAPQVDISATFIRNAIQEGRSIRYLVPDEVETFIRQKRFYA